MQPRLFDLSSGTKGSERHVFGKLDTASEAVLHSYRQRRLASGAKPATVAREISQLRSLTRGAARLGQEPCTLEGLFADGGRVARALLEPATPIAVSTGRARLVAAQRFVQMCGDEVGITTPSAFLQEVDVLLPRRVAHGWHTAGTIVAGVKTRGHPTPPTLYPQDLDRIIGTVGDAGGVRDLRDHALVALHCYSGLRPAEIVSLRMADVTVGMDTKQCLVAVNRAGCPLHLMLPRASTEPLLRLMDALAGQDAAPNSLVFRRSPIASRHLTTRAARTIVHQACIRAGYPAASAAGLRAGFAYWLRLRGFSDHEAAMVLGLGHVKSLDRLLARHMALDAQRRVRELSPERWSAREE